MSAIVLKSGCTMKDNCRYRVFLTPGLGNTLFQLAYAERNFDVSSTTFLHTIYNNSLLSRILGRSSHREFINFSDRKVEFTKFSDLLALAYLSIKKKLTKHENVTVRFAKTEWHFGYFQTKLDYSLEDEKKYLKNMISIKNNKNIEDFYTDDYRQLSIKNDRLCIIHVREGDFPSSHKIHRKYYLEIIKKISKKIDEYIIVGLGASEILQYLKDNGIENVSLLNASNEEFDFNTIFHCKNIIVSNSTFCFWAVYFGVQKNVFIEECDCYWPFVDYYKRLSNATVA